MTGEVRVALDYVDEESFVYAGFLRCNKKGNTEEWSVTAFSHP